MRSLPESSISRAGFLRTSAFVAGSLAGLPSADRTALASSPPPRSLQDKVAQLFVISFSGTTANRDVLGLLQRHALGGLVLYSRNCVTAQQTRTLLAELQTSSRFPLLVCVDQEGGRVTRIKNGAPRFPSESVYGQIASATHVSNDAAATAKALKRLGFTMNLAPVVDVLTNPRSPIGVRSYGSDPQLNARLSAAAITAYQSNGIAATAKHFIGLGHTTIDSHHLLPTVNLSLAQLAGTDLMVFKSAIAAGVSTVMVAHVALPKIDPVPGRPASLSPVIIRGVIRKQLGFKGVIMTDSLLMGALPAGHEPDAAEQAFAAGSDILLLGGNQNVPVAVIEEAIIRVTSSVQSGRIPMSRLDEAVGRVWALKQRYPPLILR